MLLIIIATISSVATLEYGMSMVLKTKENQGRKTWNISTQFITCLRTYGAQSGQQVTVNIV